MLKPEELLNRQLYWITDCKSLTKEKVSDALHRPALWIESRQQFYREDINEYFPYAKITNAVHIPPPSELAEMQSLWDYIMEKAKQYGQ